MPNVDALKAVAGISSFIGLLGALAYFYFLQQIRSVERSVREVVEGEGQYISRQIVAILEQFRDDAARLKALETLTSYDSAKAKFLLDKVKSNVDVTRLTDLSTRYYLRASGTTATVFLLLGVGGFYYSVTARAPNTSNVAASAPESHPTESPLDLRPTVLYTYTVVTKDGVVCHNGRIEKRGTGGGWVELIPSDPNCKPWPVSYEELGQDDKWFYGWDNARHMTARFPKTSGEVNWLPDKIYPYEAASKQWNVSQTVTRVN